MTLAQAVLLGTGLALAEIALLAGAALLIRRLRARRARKEWDSAFERSVGRLIVLPSPCTCCPVHGSSQPTATPAEKETPPNGHA